MIFRIEHKSEKLDGFFLGPFQTGDVSKGVVVYGQSSIGEHYPGDMPIPQDDGIKHSDDFICGFSDLHQLMEWFPCDEGRKAMYESGFRVYEYKFHEKREGSFQVCFIPKGDRRETVKLSTLERI